MYTNDIHQTVEYVKDLLGLFCPDVTVWAEKTWANERKLHLTDQTNKRVTTYDIELALGGNGKYRPLIVAARIVDDYLQKKLSEPL